MSLLRRKQPKPSERPRTVRGEARGQGKKTAVSPRLAALLGLSPDEMLNLSAAQPGEKKAPANEGSGVMLVIFIFVAAVATGVFIWCFGLRPLRNQVADVSARLDETSRITAQLNENVQSLKAADAALPLSQPTPAPPVLQAVTIEPVNGELTADGQSEIQLTIYLWADEATQTLYQSPAEVTITIPEGAGLLRYNGQEGHQLPISISGGSTQIIYRAGNFARLVSISVQAPDLPASFVTLDLQATAPTDLRLGLNPPLLQADGAAQATLTIEALAASGERVASTASVEIVANPPDLITIHPSLLQLQDGLGTATIQATGTNITETINIELTVHTADQSISNRIPLLLEPVLVLGSRCRVKTVENSKLYKIEANLVKYALLHNLPGEMEVDCTPEMDWKENTETSTPPRSVPISFVAWVQAKNIVGNVLVSVENSNIKIMVDSDPEATGKVIDFYYDDTVSNTFPAEGHPVQVLNISRDGWVQIRLEGFVVPEAIEFIP